MNVKCVPGCVEQNQQKKKNFHTEKSEGSELVGQQRQKVFKTNFLSFIRW
jgi:hypothetical protein